MGADPISIAGIAALIGSAVSGATAIKSAHDQKKAARNAAQAAEQASDTAAVTSTSTTADQGENTEAISQKNAASAAKRRYTVEDTVRNFNQMTGLRKTLN